MKLERATTDEDRGDLTHIQRAIREARQRAVAERTLSPRDRAELLRQRLAARRRQRAPR